MPPQIASVGSVQPRLSLGTTALVKELPIAEDAKPKLATALTAAVPEKVEMPAVLLRVEGIKPPENADLFFEVFLTKKGEKPSKPSYVGSITFFGKTGVHKHNNKDTFNQGFDVTKMVQKIRRANRGTLPLLEVSIVPHSTAGLTDADLAKQKIDVPISNITLKLVTAEQKK